MRLIGFLAAVIVMLSLASAGMAQAPLPLAIRNAAIGGGPLNQYTPGVDGGVGLNNIGLLIRTWGRVTFRDDTNKFFYINDGANRLDGSGNVGVRISYDNLAPGNTITTLPGVNSYVAITGISSTTMLSSRIEPNVRVRRQDDIQIIVP